MKAKGLKRKASNNQTHRDMGLIEEKEKPEIDVEEVLSKYD